MKVFTRIKLELIDLSQNRILKIQNWSEKRKLESKREITQLWNEARKLLSSHFLIILKEVSYSNSMHCILYEIKIIIEADHGQA